MDVDSDDSGDIQFENHLTATKVYRSLWAEFYSWEQAFCSQTLERLSNPGFRPRSLPDEKDTISIYGLPVVSSSSEQELFTYQDISPDSTVTVKFTLCPNPKIVEAKSLEPCAGYTACTPASTNIILKEDPSLLPFIPYADDPLFGMDDYLSRFGWFTWQHDMDDPDRKYSFLFFLTFHPLN